MLSKNVETLLRNLAKIETAVARVYEKFATNDRFTSPAREFWASTMSEELEHAKLFNTIRETAKQDDSIEVKVDFEMDQFKKSVNEFNTILRGISEEDISESKAYSIGAFIEININEFGFSKRVRTNNDEIAKTIRRIENDTNKHYRLLYNYSLGKRSPLQPPSAPEPSNTENKS